MVHMTQDQAGIILVVDDNPDNLRVFTSILSSEGYDVRATVTGQLGLQAARTGQPDLIILDVDLPDMSGFDVCEHLKADPALAEIPVIFVSALDAIADKIRAFEVGGIDYVTKPIQHAEVVARVRNHMALRRFHQQGLELVRLQERQRMARDLHDTMSQLLFSANMMTETLIINVDNGAISEADIVRQLARLNSVTKGLMADMRSLLLELRPEILVQSTLSELLEMLLLCTRGHTYAEISLEVAAVTLEESVKLAFYRIAQEAINNIIKHAEATYVSIKVEKAAEAVEMTLQDNGIGFSSETVPPDRFGLRNMQERAEGVGARLTLTSERGRGTRINLRYEYE